MLLKARQWFVFALFTLCYMDRALSIRHLQIQRRNVPLFCHQTSAGMPLDASVAPDPTAHRRRVAMNRTIRHTTTNWRRIEMPRALRRTAGYRLKHQRHVHYNNRTVQTFTSDTTIACPSSQLPVYRSNGIDIPYESTVEALRVYHAIHGDLAMPRRFRVPDGCGYPNEWVGVDLAATVYNMKWWKKHISEAKTERVSELNRIGFVWERLQPEWNLVLEALVTYHSLHGDVMVTNKFVVPHGYRQWPKATWNIPLGNCVYRIRVRNDFLLGVHAASRRNQLDSLGFVWDVHEHRFLKFFAVLRHYAKLNKAGVFSPTERPKQLRVPSSFTVPENDDRWPSELHNYPLGSKCTAIRQKQLYVKNKLKRQRMLEEIGFCWNGNADLSWLKVVHAAAIYSKLHDRKLDVPYKFVVPEPPAEMANVSDEWPWPEQLWGLPLGQRLKDIRLTGAYLKGNDKEARRRQLEAMGFIWDVREHKFQRFYAALQHFAKLNNAGMYSQDGQPTPVNVPVCFVVPSNDDAWPSELWKFNLGKTTSAVRLRGLYSVQKNEKRRAQLRELGLEIKDANPEKGQES
jgi:hypothetical protein